MRMHFNPYITWSYSWKCGYISFMCSMIAVVCNHLKVHGPIIRVAWWWTH